MNAPIARAQFDRATEFAYAIAQVADQHDADLQRLELSLRCFSGDVDKLAANSTDAWSALIRECDAAWDAFQADTARNCRVLGIHDMQARLRLMVGGAA